MVTTESRGRRRHLDALLIHALPLSGILMAGQSPAPASIGVGARFKRRQCRGTCTRYPFVRCVLSLAMPSVDDARQVADRQFGRYSACF